jgi:hypothetical protein
MRDEGKINQDNWSILFSRPQSFCFSKPGMTALADSEASRKNLMLRIARMRREKRIRFWRVCSVVAFFAVAIGGNLFIGMVVLRKNFCDLIPFTSSKSDGPARTAKIRRPMLDGTFCRNIVFDNTTAQAVVDKIERCDGGPNRPSTVTYAEPPRFTWGK